MTKRATNIITTVLCSTAVLLLFAVSAAVSAEQTPKTVIAKVNGVSITQGEREMAVNELLAQSRSAQQPTPEMMQKAREAALEQLIGMELLYQKGKKIKIKDLDKQVDTRITQTKARFPSPAEYEKALQKSNITEKQLREFSRKNIVITNLLQKEVFDKISVSEADAKKFYDENPDKFKQDERTRASHILISAEQKATPEEKKKAKEKAEAVRKRVAAGEDFATVAKAESKCPSAPKGGDLGYFGKGQMAPAFETAASALKLGQISDVVETEFGYHIIKVTERKPAETVKFDDVKQKIEDYLKGQKSQQPLADYVGKLRKAAKVEIMK